MSQKPKIKDIPKFKKMRVEMKGFKLLKNALPFASPFLKILGIDATTMKEAFADFDNLESEFIRLSELPDKFNDAFSSRGFITFEFLNPDVAEEALEIAEKNLDDGEEFLINHFSPESVESYLHMMRGIRAFRPRIRLAELALEDYKEKRYHACVLVVLALTDGLVNELNPQNLGMAAENSNLMAWDSITAHEKGLNTLKELFLKTRKTTRTETITIPYRHGIMHGMDLGYDNKDVAAKTWALLFAVGDWALKAETGKLSEPAPEPQTTFTETLQRIRENAETSQKLNEWKARPVEIGKDIPRTGSIEDYEEGTPERKLVEFLTFWQKKNYGHMANCIKSYLQRSPKEMAGKVRNVYESYSLNSFELEEVIDEAPVISEIRVLLKYELHSQLVTNRVKFRLVINDSKDGRVLLRGMPEATWGIINWEYGTFILTD